MLALRELVRQPRRFAPVAGALTLLTVLLVVLGGFLDGLELSQTGAYRAHAGFVIVYDDEADRQIQRSNVQADVLAGSPSAAIARLGGLDTVFTVAGAPGADLEDVALFGYDLPAGRLPSPPPPGSVFVDRQLERTGGIGLGDVLEVGPTSERFSVAAVIDDLTTGPATVWMSTAEWRRVVSLGNPAALPPEGSHHALVVDPVGSADELASMLSGVPGIDAVTSAQAIEALDVVQQQSSTFAGIIGVTFVITLMVVALFFALITLERVGLYAVLKALGARTGELLAGVSVQAGLISIASLAAGGAISWIFVSALPPELPIRLETVRLVQIAVGTCATSVAGSLFTARRLLSIDPAEAIG